MKRIHRLSLGLVLAVLVTAGAAQAQARTWSLSRDTTVERYPSGLADSMNIVNQSVDTLRFDSVLIEAVRPVGLDTIRVVFQHGATSQYFLRRNGSVQQSPGIAQLRVAPNQSLRLHGFEAESGLVPVAKRAGLPVGDSLSVRLIFVAAASRGRDTLLLVGKQDQPSSSAILRGPNAQASSRIQLFLGREGVRFRDDQGMLYNLHGKRLPEQVRAAGTKE